MDGQPKDANSSPHTERIVVLNKKLFCGERAKRSLSRRAYGQ
jgi:hypothetical protein